MAQIKVHGISYDLPESFTLKEMRIIERYTGGHLDGFNLSKIAATIHVAIMRAKPELPFEEIEAVVDDLPADQLDKIVMTVKDAGGQSPPAQEPNGNGASSSAGSGPSSDAALESETPEPSGSPDSGFSAFYQQTSSS